MKTNATILSVLLVGLLAFTGFAAATGGAGFAATDTQATANGYGPGDDTGPIATDGDRPLDGSNSPWMTDDERLERFQDRFDLTDGQMATIQEEVQSLVADDATPDEIRATVTEMLESYGVEEPVLGPPVDGRQAAGPFGQGPGAGAGQGSAGQGGSGFGGAGPHGPADGSCLN